MWFCRFYNNLPSQVKQAQKTRWRRSSGFQEASIRGWVRVDENKEGKKGLMLVKGGGKGTDVFKKVGQGNERK